MIEGEVTLESRAITLTVRDEVRHTQIAKVAYPNTLDTLTLCTEKEALGNTCSRIGNPNSVELITFANTNISSSVTDDTLVLGESIKPLVEYRVGNGWSLAGGVSLELDPLASTRSFVINIRSNNEIIGKLILTTDTTLSVGRSDDGVKVLRKTPILDTKDITYTLRQVYTQKFDPSLYGYSIIASN